LKSIALFDNSLLTMLPDEFEDMPPGMIQAMFPNEKRPQVIKGSADGSYATFTLLKKSLSRQQLFTASHNALLLLQKFFPSCCNQKVHLIQLEDSMCGWFSFLGHGKKNIMFIIAIDGKMLLGSCGCREDDHKRMDELKMAFLSMKTAKEVV
jgi:putative lipoic acid-binding regulatory protein